MSFHPRLIEATQTERTRFRAIPILDDALHGRISRSEYLAFLTQAYHHVRHTVPLLMACGARVPAHLEWLREAVGEYIEEEMGHQEWILDDIAEAGGNRIGAALSRPGAATELMVAYAYDTIARGNPVGFFGMVLVLEGTSVALATRAADAIEQTLALPRSAFTYLRSHGDLDVAHMGFFERLMDRLEDPADQAAVIHAARVFYRLYGDVFVGLRAAAAHPSQAEAA
ncbi:MAG: iron-containing redox enzyme family protein [Xanthomonadaceae bacterium]|nr:iron-containing redox enzyme family protein [Xanthomonadaceae bacterium]